MKLKFIYWFAFYNNNSPSVRYRAYYPLNFLKEKYMIGSYFVVPGYRPLKIIFFLKAYFSAMFFRKANSLIVIQRVHSNFIYANLLKLLLKVQKENVVYDLDDADYLEFPPETIYHFIKNCNAVTVGSSEMVKNLTKYNQKIILNTSPTPNLDIKKETKNNDLVVGWIGEFGGGHKVSLSNYFFPALRDLPFNIKLIILGAVEKKEQDFLSAYFRHYKNVTLEIPKHIDWTDETKIQQLITTFDIGVATLLDNELQRSKSAFKAKQYLNNGVPVLSSNISENNTFIDNENNGFLCPDVPDFRKRIIEIKNMSDKDYLRLSGSARESITKFDLKYYCDNLINTYEKINSY